MQLLERVRTIMRHGHIASEIDREPYGWEDYSHTGRSALDYIGGMPRANCQGNLGEGTGVVRYPGYDYANHRKKTETVDKLSVTFFSRFNGIRRFETSIVDK